MGWRSQQYGSFERFLVALADRCQRDGASTTLVFQAPPVSTAFLEQVAADVVVLPGALTPADPRFARALARLLHERSASHLHAHFGSDAYASVAVARALGVRRRFTTKHITPAEGAISALRHRVLAAQVETFFTVSESVRQRVVGLGVPERKVVLCRLGVDVSAYRPGPDAGIAVRRQLGLVPGQRLVLSTSHLRPGKGVELLPLLAADLHDVTVVLAGDGPLRPWLAAEAARLGLGPRLRLLGVRQDVPDLLAAADLVVFPTTANEGLPLGPLEAVAAGVPLVASAVSDLPGLFGGLVDLVPPGSFEALRDACRHVLADPAAALLRAEAAAAHLARELSVHQAAEVHAERYLSGAASPRPCWAADR